MITQKDIEIISHLRSNARKKVTDIAKDVNIPVTTIYDKIRAHEKKGILKKHVALLDFAKMGYNANVLLAISINRDKRDSLKNYLVNHPNVNSLYRTDFGTDFLVEVVFENSSALQEFMDSLDISFNLNEIRTFNLSQELKKEGFLGRLENNGLK